MKKNRRNSFRHLQNNHSLVPNRLRSGSTCSKCIFHDPQYQAFFERFIEYSFCYLNSLYGSKICCRVTCNMLAALDLSLKYTSRGYLMTSWRSACLQNCTQMTLTFSKDTCHSTEVLLMRCETPHFLRCLLSPSWSTWRRSKKSGTCFCCIFLLNTAQKGIQRTLC